MYNTSAAYKLAADLSGRLTKLDIDYGDVVISSDNVLSYFKFLDALITDEKKSIIGAFPMAKINYTLIGNQEGYIFAHANRQIDVSASLWVSGAFEEVPMGTFIVTNAPTDNKTDEIAIEAMDSSVLFDKPYVLPTTWPKTVHDWADEICTQVGIVLGSTAWLNSTISIPEVLVEGSYRDAIKIIAAAGGCFAHMGRDNKLYFRTVSTVSRDFMEVFEYSQSENYGPVNSLVLTKDPTNDNVGILDQTSIDLNGKTEVQIDNNPILETDRETLITPLFATISGLTFVISSIEYTGDPSIDLGDIVHFLDQDSTLQNLTVLSIQFEHTGSWGGSLAAIAPSKTDIETDYVGTYDKRLKRTEIMVDKVNGEILLVASAVVEAQATADNIIVGGRNYLLNSAFTVDLSGWAAWQTAVISYNESENLNINYPSITNQYSGVLQDTNKLSVIIGDVYTISAYIKRDDASIQPSLQVGGAWEDVSDQSVVGVWCVVKATLIMTATATSPKVYLHSSNAGLTTGNLEVAWIKVEKGNKATDWTPAPEDIQTQIDVATTNAATANGLLADLASDNKLTAVEKQMVKKEWDGIVSEKTLNDTQATTFGITTEKTAYGTSYTTLSTYITPLLTDLTATSDIVGATFRANFKDYYDKLTMLLNAIAGKAKTLADNAQTTANSKAKTFIATPTTPYSVGDKWIDTNATTGGNKVCTNQRLTGAYVSGDWTKEGITSRVDSAESLITPTAIISTVTSSTEYIDDLGGKEATIYKQTTAPETATDRFWLDTSVTPNVLKRWNGSAWVKVTPTVAGEVGAYTKDEVDTTFTQTAIDFTFAVGTKEDAFYKQATEPFEQLITNGDFSDGITGWATQAGINTSSTDRCISSPNSLKNVATGSGSFVQTSVLSVIGHIYYVSWNYYISSFISGSIFIQFSSGADVVSSPIVGAWTKRSSVFTDEQSGTHGNAFCGMLSGTATSYIDNFIVIDLTAAFGAGNEPTLAQMDLNIKRLWLDTLTNTYKSFDGGGWKPSSLLKGAKYVFDGEKAKYYSDGQEWYDNSTPPVLKVYFDTVNSKYVFNGEVVATSGSIGRLSIIDDDIYYQSDLFAKQYDNSDVTRLNAIIVGRITATTYDSYVYDINSSGALSSTDLVMMRRIINGLDAPLNNKMIRSIITIGKTTGQITVSSISTDGYVGPSFTMQADKIFGKMANIESASIGILTLNGLEVYSDAGTLKVR